MLGWSEEGFPVSPLSGRRSGEHLSCYRVTVEQNVSCCTVVLIGCGKPCRPFPHPFLFFETVRVFLITIDGCLKSQNMFSLIFMKEWTGFIYTYINVW